MVIPKKILNTKDINIININDKKRKDCAKFRIKLLEREVIEISKKENIIIKDIKNNEIKTNEKKEIINARIPFPLSLAEIKDVPNFNPKPREIKIAGSSKIPWGKSLHKTKIPSLSTLIEATKPNK